MENIEYDIVGLFFYMATLHPLRGSRDAEFRYESARAIAAVTEVPEERLTLARIQSAESGFRRSVTRCEISGDHGKSKGGWQVQPRSPSEAKLACGSLFEQAGLALQLLRHSNEYCSKNQGVARFNLYMSGRCDHGTKAAEARIVLDAGAEAERFRLGAVE